MALAGSNTRRSHFFRSPPVKWAGLRVLGVTGLVSLLAGCVHAPIRPVAARPVAVAQAAPAPVAAPASPQASGAPRIGLASWYRSSRVHRRTCTGQRMNDRSLTAASATLPMDTLAEVSTPDDNRSVVVRVNDCMPPGRRLIDLSEAAARRLGILQSGLAKVTVTPVRLAENP